MNLRALATLVCALGLASCSTLETLPLVSDLPKVPVPEALRIEDTVDTPHTVIERALSGCDKRTEPGEAACVKAGLAEAKVSVPSLMAMLPGCHAGQMCHITYTTEDMVGLFHATASRFTVHWRVDADFSKPRTTLDAVPITVVQV